MIGRASLAAAAALWAGSAAAQPHDMSKMQGMMGLPPMPSVYAGQADKPGAPVFQGLGDHRMAITATPEAQRYFDQGVNLVFGFNHAEAIRSFRQAARLDPNCAMCWWGVALALGSNINLPMPDDAVIPAWHADVAAGLAPGATVEVIPDAGHFPHKDHPQQFMRMLDDFIRSHPAASYHRGRWRKLLVAGPDAPPPREVTPEARSATA
jgi:pimeloyl-ACP methyl ester carboxylesterase